MAGIDHGGFLDVTNDCPDPSTASPIFRCTSMHIPGGFNDEDELCRGSHQETAGRTTTFGTTMGRTPVKVNAGQDRTTGDSDSSDPVNRSLAPSPRSETHCCCPYSSDYSDYGLSWYGLFELLAVSVAPSVAIRLALRRSLSDSYCWTSTKARLRSLSLLSYTTTPSAWKQRRA
ncbi:hypothetical protein PYCC9005_005514 [Savitreella phatthalungensis]